MNIKITDAKITAAERAVPILRLLEQIVLYRRPGQYHFAADFLAEYAAWTEIVTIFRRSGVKDVRALGRSMADVTRYLREVDEAAASGDVRRVRRKVAALDQATKTLVSAGKKLTSRLITEAVVDVGN
ncbi:MULTISPECIES: hypothetical protein [unclassified Paenibacillus]|uniref:hypothetical protein n=1 Tax=unclassified Paenibacillus TaxID=185978 RepID=UPI0030F82898